jgi:hypothetical protein
MKGATGNLESQGYVELTARCFNATGHSIYLHKASGNITVQQSSKGASKDVGKLPAAALILDKKKN